MVFPKQDRCMQKARIAKGRGAGRAGSLLLLALVVASLLASPAQAAVANNRVLLLYDTSEERFKLEVDLLKEILKAGGIPEAQISVKPVDAASTSATISGYMTAGFGPAGNTDAKIVYYTGHALEPSDDANGDEPEAAPKKDEHMKKIRDDDLGPAWAGVNGKKLIVYSQCYAGGMFDGTSDPSPADSYNIGAYAHNVKGTGTKFAYVFATALVGAADGADGSVKNSEITPKEIKAYLDSKLTGLAQPVYKSTSATAPDTPIVSVPVAPPAVPDPAEPDPHGDRCMLAGVPTLSEWGLIILGGLLLSVGTLVVIRRRP